MVVQESGVAVGWPLNLGHDTTGWPLGLRLRLMHEDLQWPKLPDLALSSSRKSTDSSSLDTMSTKSFFQDKSISLGALIGLPILDSAGNRQQRAFLSPTAPVSTPSASPVQTRNNPVRHRSKPLRHRLGRSPVTQQQHHAFTSSTTQGSPSAASNAGWSLLSVLSCARVPAEIGAPVTEAGETVIPRAQLAARQVHSSSAVSELEIKEKVHDDPGPPMLLSRNSSQQRLNSLARKFYDNITFEDEELEMSNNRNRNSGSSSDGSTSSKEWNPLFASSPQAARDEQETEDDDDQGYPKSGPMATPCDHSLEQQASCTTVPLITLMRTSRNDSDSLLYIRRGSRQRKGCSTSTIFCVDLRKWQQKQQQKKQEQLGQEKCELVDTLTEQDGQFTSRPAGDSSKNKAISAFINRMVCCRSTPTRGSSF